MIKGQVSKYFDFSYFWKFILVFLGLYYCHIAFNGIVSEEGGYYSPILDKYFNYLSWLTLSILHVARFIVSTVGISSNIQGSQVLESTSGLGINLWLPCLGLGITSFWIAYIVAQTATLRKKIYWGLGGFLAIWFINCWRIALLLMSLDFGWKGNQYFDHHTLFNLAAYGAIFALITIFNRTNKSSSLQDSNFTLSTVERTSATTGYYQ